MEPQWTKQIPSTAICSTYYVLFFIYAALAVITLVGTVYVLVYVKLPKGVGSAFGFQGIIMSVLITVLSLFQYLVCSRALLGEQIVKVTKEDFYAAGAIEGAMKRSSFKNSTRNQHLPPMNRIPIPRAR